MAPRATYRLQLRAGFGFAEARALVPYLRELGVSHLYLSPALQARPGSTHGYDVIDPRRVSSELGGEEGLRELAAAGLPILLDFVPNHMGASADNPFWSDPALRERFFDIDPVTGRWRRFFDIDDMPALRQEDPEVFAATHAKALELVADGVVFGLRIDHPDGLADPAGYLERLREAGVHDVWVEKILSPLPAPGEALREWPVRGTVGYEFLNDLAALFIDPGGEEGLSALWAELSGDPRPYGEVAVRARLEQARGTFASEVERLARVDADFGAETLVRALATMPVYRTYVVPGRGIVAEADRAALDAADVAGPLRRAMLLEDRAPAELVTRFQQTSPAIMAKGVEDTAFYRYLRLVALNEVGGAPDRFGLSVADFHAANAARARRFPSGLLATQTHDTKRSGDTRARIGALASLPGRWREHVLRWRAMGARLPSGGPPAPAVEYLLYQTLVGVWPIERGRLDAYLVKALREAKQQTNWITPDEAFEGAALRFAHELLDHPPFVADLEAFLDVLVPLGERSALGQLVLKLTAPGVPDIYQGDELWRLALVDPDNRRPVDWDERRAALARVVGDGGRGAPARHDAKLFCIHRALGLRARRPGAFAGPYEPVEAGADVCAYLRGEAEVLVAVVVRGTDEATLSLPTAAAGGRWRDVLRGGGPVELGETTRLRGEDDVLSGLWLMERG